MCTSMLAVTIVMIVMPPVMVTLIKEVEPLTIYVEHVVTGCLQSSVHVIHTHLTVEAARNSDSVETTVINNIHLQKQHPAFAPNG